MAREIERKFLVLTGDWLRDVPGTSIRQGYLALDARRAVRVRIAGDKAYLNIKAVEDDLVHREEFEYAIPLDDAEALLARHCLGRLIEKTRYRIDVAGRIWEVDVFEGANAGLVVAELELERADAPFERPPWLGEEVSYDPRFLNTSLCAHPYSAWNEGDLGAGDALG